MMIVAIVLVGNAPISTVLAQEIVAGPTHGAAAPGITVIADVPAESAPPETPAGIEEAVAAGGATDPEAPAATPAPGEASEPAAAPDAAATEPGADAETAAAAEAAAEGSSWFDELSMRVFADAYVAGHWTLPNAFANDHTDMLGHRAYDANAGLNLAFVGLDFRYAPDPIGVTIDLRFGSAVPRLLGAFSGLPEGVQFVKQAFVSWAPVSQFRIDFGEFDTIYGAEVSESWLNPTYTRGSLYNVVQPFYHTGFRAVWSPIDEFSVTAIAVNGWNNVLDNNDGKSGGIQFAYSSGGVTLSAGYMTGPEQAGVDDRFRHLVDAVARVDVGDLSLWGNFDITVEDIGDGNTDTLAGGMVAARYGIIPEFAIAARGEYLHDPDTASGLGTGTVTLEVTPASHLVIRLDTRVDVATDDRFVDTQAQPSQTAVSSVLGVVVHSDD